VTPLKVDLAVEIEIAPLEGNVARSYEKGKTYPKEEAPPKGLPSFARIGTDALTRIPISSASH